MTAQPGKLDLKKTQKDLYAPSTKTIALVDVPPMQFLLVDGQGNPNTAQAYQDALEALFAVSYAIKFISKRGPAALDYTVMPLEGLWWVPDMAAFSLDDRDSWLWTAMIRQPDHVTPAMVDEAIADTRRKKNPAALDLLRFETYAEGLAAQVMHLGPYADEGPTMARLHGWILDNGYDYHGAGKHHEIYLSDVRRTAPEKLKTVLRQPVIRREA